MTLVARTVPTKKPWFLCSARSCARAALAMTFGVAQFDANDPSQAKPDKNLIAIKTGTRVSFGSLKQIDGGILNVGWRKSSPANGSPFILLHGWPHDVYSFADVATETI
jgi:hypothetical protein